jgi:hypothetical protein
VTSLAATSRDWRRRLDELLGTGVDAEDHWTVIRARRLSRGA